MQTDQGRCFLRIFLINAAIKILLMKVYILLSEIQLFLLLNLAHEFFFLFHFLITFNKHKIVFRYTLLCSPHPLFCFFCPFEAHKSKIFRYPPPFFLFIIFALNQVQNFRRDTYSAHRFISSLNFLL